MRTIIFILNTLFIILILASIIIISYNKVMDFIEDYRRYIRFTKEGNLREEHIELLRNSVEHGSVLLIDSQLLKVSLVNPQLEKVLNNINNGYVEIDNTIDDIELFVKVADSGRNVIMIKSDINNVSTLEAIGSLVSNGTGLIISEPFIYDNNVYNYIVENGLVTHKLYRLSLVDSNCSKIKVGYSLTVENDGKVKTLARSK